MKGYIVNLTVNVDNAYTLPWITWAREDFFPFLRQWSFVEDVVFTRVISREEGDNTYSIQVVVTSQQGVAYFERDCLPNFINMATNLFSGKVVFFKTLLELL